MSREWLLQLGLLLLLLLAMVFVFNSMLWNYLTLWQSRVLATIPLLLVNGWDCRIFEFSRAHPTTHHMSYSIHPYSISNSTSIPIVTIHTLNRPFFPFVALFHSTVFFFPFSFAHLLCHSLVCIHNFSIIGSSHTKISSKPYRVIQSCNQMLCSYLHGYVKLNLT